MTAATTSRAVAPTPAGGSLDKIQGPAVASRRKPGRPRGSRGVSQDNILVVSFFARTACPKCGSEHRTRYYGRRSLAAGGVENGRFYQRVVLRRCRCLGCGTVRVDRELSN